MCYTFSNFMEKGFCLNPNQSERPDNVITAIAAFPSFWLVEILI